ncbi:MAG: DUF447 domain-containing protein [Hyphomicrobium sp.]
MPKIIEAIVITQNKIGDNHIVPLGLISDNEGWIIAPFRPSVTIDNLLENPYAVANLTDDIRVFAGCITGRRNWETVPADMLPGRRLAKCVTHWELKVERIINDKERPRFHCSSIHVASHQHWGGFNRAQAAILELAVLTTRLDRLPREKVEMELDYLNIAISKTAGPFELEAKDWLMERIEFWRKHSVK